MSKMSGENGWFNVFVYLQLFWNYQTIQQNNLLIDHSFRKINKVLNRIQDITVMTWATLSKQQQHQEQQQQQQKPSQQLYQ